MISRLKKLLLLALLACLCLVGNGCWSSDEPDNFAYVLAIGVDKGEENRIKMTYLIANSKEMGAGKEGGDAAQKSLITSIETPSLFVTLNTVNTYIGRKLTLMHAKIIIFSEETARSGLMGSFVPAMGQYREVRGTMFIGVTKGKAADRINAIKPILETNPAKYIELVASSGVYTGFIPQTELLNTMYISLSSDGIEPVTMLFGPSREQAASEDSADDGGELTSDAEEPVGGAGSAGNGMTGEYRAEGDYVAGTLPREGGINFGAMGAAAFRGQVMVGEMTGDEVVAWGMLTGKYRTSIMSLIDPLVPDTVLSATVSEGRKPRVRVRLEDGKPYIDVEVTLEGDILGIQSLIDYQQPDKQPVLEAAYTEKLAGLINGIIKKSQEEFRSDIFGFGLYARRLYLTQEQWKAVHWEEIYPEAEINATVNFKIRRSGMLIQIMPIINPEAGVEEGDND